MIADSVIEVHVNHGTEAGIGEGVVRRAVTRVLSGGGVRSAEVSVTFLSDHGIQGLNKSYLGHDWPTDVLSFTLSDTGGEVRVDEPRLVGDIYIGVDRLAEQAAERRITAHEEGIRLAIHGALHLLGRDHPEGPDREESDFFRDQETWVSRVLVEEPEA